MTISNPSYLKTDKTRFEIITTHSETVKIYDAICHRKELEDCVHTLLKDAPSADQELIICVFDTAIAEGIECVFVHEVRVNVRVLDEIPYADAAFRVLKFEEFDKD